MKLRLPALTICVKMEVAMLRTELTAIEFVQVFESFPPRRWSKMEMEHLLNAVPSDEWDKIPRDKQRAALDIALPN